MSNNNLKKQTVDAVAWSGSIQLASQITTFLLGIVLARLLTPEAYGLVAIVLIFTAFSTMLTDIGFSSALIQKKNATPIMFQTCYWTSTLIGIFLMLVLIAVAPLISALFNSAELLNLVQVMSVIFFLSAACSVPRAKMAKALRHKNIAIAEMCASLVGIICAIGAATFDLQYWSLAIMHLVTNIVKFILFHVFAGFTPKFTFSLLALKELLGFSSTVFITGVLRLCAQQADKALLGRYIDVVTLGLYGRAQQLVSFPVNSISRVVGNVLFPAMSGIQDDKPRITRLFLNSIGAISVLAYPLLGGIFVVAEPFISFVFGQQWLGMTIYVQYFCVLGLLNSISTITGSVYLALGEAKLQLKLNMVYLPTQILGLFVGVQYGTLGLLYGFAVTYLFSVLLTWSFASRLLEISILSIFKSLLFALLATGMMVTCVKFIQNSILSEASDLVVLLSSLTVGAVVYSLAVISVPPPVYSLILSFMKR